jgi:hypothetical protein
MGTLGNKIKVIPVTGTLEETGQNTYRPEGAGKRLINVHA